MGGFDGVGQQEGGHHVDDALQLAVGPDGGTVLLRLLARVEPAHGNERPAQCDIDRRRHSVVIVFVHGCKIIKKYRNVQVFRDLFLMVAEGQALLCSSYHIGVRILCDMTFSLEIFGGLEKLLYLCRCEPKM